MHGPLTYEESLVQLDNDIEYYGFVSSGNSPVILQHFDIDKNVLNVENKLQYNNYYNYYNYNNYNNYNNYYNNYNYYNYNNYFLFGHDNICHIATKIYFWSLISKYKNFKINFNYSKMFTSFR